MKPHAALGNPEAILLGAFKRSAPELSRGLRDYALSASVRLCDPTKPLLLSLAVEAFIASQALVVWAQSAQAANPRRPRNRRCTAFDFHPALEQRKGIFLDSSARVKSRRGAAAGIDPLATLENAQRQGAPIVH